MAKSWQAGMCDRSQNKGYKQALDRSAYSIVMKLARSDAASAKRVSVDGVSMSSKQCQTCQ